MFGFRSDYVNGTTENAISRLRDALAEADAVVLGAGAGLSTSAGFSYAGERFLTYFKDFADKYGIRDMYSGGFYPFPTLEEFWAWWSRHIYVNRYVAAPRDVYARLFDVVRDKDYFVITTNVDHQFQKSGFDKNRLFYTQGDYGLWQCSVPCHDKTYDNEETVRKMLLSQGFSFADDGELRLPENGFDGIQMSVPSDLVPKCPVCGKPMAMNLRADDTFVEDEGWHTAAERYHEFLRRHEGLRVVYLDIGCGMNTPVIFKYPFWRMVAENEKATYVCLNKGEAFAPDDIAARAICVDGDVGATLDAIKKTIS